MIKEKTLFRNSLRDFFKSDTIGRKLWDMFIYGLIFLSIIQLSGEYGLLTWNLNYSQNLMMDLIIASIFSVDYIARFYAAPKRLKYFTNIFSIIDLMAILPSFVGIGQAKALRVLRILRLLRFLRIIKFIRSLEIKDDFQKLKKSEAFEEVAFYDKLLNWYQQNIKNNIVISEFKNLSQIIEEARELSIITNKKIKDGSDRMADDKQTFFISFFELITQIQIVLANLSNEATNLNILKLRYLIREIGLLLSAEHTKGTVNQLIGDAINRD